MHKWGQTDNGTDLTKQHCRFFPVICITVIFYDDIGKRLPGAGETLNSQEHMLLFQTTQLPFPELPSGGLQPSPTPAPGVLKPLVSAGVCTQCTNSYADTHTSTDNYKYFFKKLKENCFSWKKKRLYPAVLRSSSHYLSSQSESEVQLWNQSPREWSSRDIQNSWVRDFSGTRVSQREDTSKWNWGSDHCSRERVYKQASL